ncbi:MAG: response regulator, partial [Deltaproteobacteria bacterium]|nr:response regulator [Deltaproteobacteria bacterium]
NTGEKAIKKAEEDKPDLILMDIRIKGEMDGIDTAEVIRNRFGIPVIFSTAYLDQERIERAKITMPFGYRIKFQKKPSRRTTWIKQLGDHQRI